VIDNKTASCQKNSFGDHLLNLDLRQSERNYHLSDAAYSVDSHMKNFDPSTTNNGDWFSIKSGSTRAFSWNDQVAKFGNKNIDDSEADDIEMLRKKKEELLKIQLYVKQSLKDIHSKLNKTGTSKLNESSKVNQNISGINKIKKKPLKTKTKAAKNVWRPLKKTEDKHVHSSKQNTMRTKKMKKQFKKIDQSGGMKLAKISKRINESTHSITPAKIQKKHNFIVDDPINIMTSFDNSKQNKIEMTVKNNIKPACKNFVEKNLTSGRRDLSNNSNKTTELRRDRSTRNVQRKDDIWDALMNRVAATPDHSKSVYDGYV
jgi:hypothetical protein